MKRTFKEAQDMGFTQALLIHSNNGEYSLVFWMNPNDIDEYSIQGWCEDTEETLTIVTDNWFFDENEVV